MIGPVIYTYRLERQILLDYLYLKLAQNDLHGARDCIVDIELLDAKHKHD